MGHALAFWGAAAPVESSAFSKFRESDDRAPQDEAHLRKRGFRVRDGQRVGDEKTFC